MKTKYGVLAVAVVISGMLGGCATSNTVKNEEPVQQAQKAEAPKTVVAPPTVAAVQKPAVDPNANKQLASGASSKKAAPVSAFEKVYFAFDSSTLSAEARDLLTKNYNLLKLNAAQTVSIEGHCDERGSAEYNMALGERRAIAAKKFLVTLGATDKQFKTISYGKERPAVQGNDEAAWAKNRRDEFVVAK